MNKKKLQSMDTLSVRQHLERVDTYLLESQNELHSTSSTPIEIVFAISLKSKQVSENWCVVQDNLSKTLRSILNNTHTNYQIFIAGHEKPDIKEMAHKQVNWVPVNISPPKNPKGFTRDKMLKRKIIGSALKKKGFSGYFMPLDADDLIHFRFVEYINSLSFFRAIIIKKGLMINFHNNEKWVLDDFYLHCGSCAIFYFSNKEFPNSVHEYKKLFSMLTLNSHPKIINRLSRLKINFKEVEHPVVLRLFGHGENNMYLKGTLKKNVTATDYKTRGESIGEWLNGFFNYQEMKD